ncbi:RNA 3 -terminal phosphate cyclase [Brachionus plicatilis]|uniref:RNA 3-terminal phosphate cyclase n=1 Tax=Brachionus plicatilis TaxID=10195 RepID=A0A3M7S6M4_BRAPC|nr:RNA 3 -terminal phosphate cyclase [Brachionus plicatilis]
MTNDSDCPLRIKIILSVLSGKPLKLKNIRRNEHEPGLKDFEVNLLKLVDKLTSGTRTDINETGTSLYFVPGILIGGKIEHDCGTERSIGYFLQTIMCMAPFTKTPLELTLTGITNDPDDVSVDLIKYSSIPIFKRFIGSDDGLEFKVLKRGAKPGGGGEILFKCPTKMKLIPVNLTDPGKIKRIRGIAYAMRVAPAVCNRMVEKAKGTLLKFIPDIYIISDHQKKDTAGNSPGFGLTLVAETTNGTFLCGEACSTPKGSDSQEPNVPEDIALKATHNLLEEIYRGGCVDSANQFIAYMLMVINQRDVSRILSGIFSPFSIHFMRAIKDSFGVRFKIEPCRSQEVDFNHKKIIQEKEDEKNAKKKKRKRNLQLPAEINASENESEVDEEEEQKKKKQKLDDEEKEKSIKEYLKLGHEKLLLSCLGIGFTNLSKTYI